MKKISIGINGFGRFGLHLLKYWLDRNEEAKFSVDFINDDVLTVKDAYEIMLQDPYVIFNKYKILLQGNRLILLEPNGSKHVIEYTTSDHDNIPWVGMPKILFECSGKNTVAKNCERFLKNETRLVLISATSWDTDKTLIFGFNHQEFNDKEHKIISYGSCTVNAYVPFAQFMHQKYSFHESDVNVVHNIQQYRLEENKTLNRKFCTLERSGPNLLPFLNKDNFTVNYTVVPHTGVSLIDFRFRLKKNTDPKSFIKDLSFAVSEGPLKNLYGFDEVDIGPEIHNCTTYSAVFIKEGIRIVGENVYLQAYFDTENSVNRYYDLSNYLIQTAFL